MANSSRRLPFLMEMCQDAAKLRVCAEISQRRVATGNEDIIKRLQSFTRNCVKWPWTSKAVFFLHALDELLLALPFLEVTSEFEQAFAIRIGRWYFAFGRGKGYLVPSIGEGGEGLCKLHYEEATFFRTVSPPFFKGKLSVPDMMMRIFLCTIFHAGNTK
jgi:hypothetical protein